MTFEIIAQATVSGLLMGLIYALIAAGLSLIFGLMNIVNFAHGEHLMLSMFSSFWLWSLFGLDPIVSLPFTVLLMAACGVLTHYLLIRFILKAKMLIQICATFGLSIFLRSLAQFFWTPDFRSVDQPLLEGRIEIANVFIGQPQFFAGGVCLLAFLALYLFVTRTETGLALQATAQDREAAEILGIPSDRMFALGWAIGLGCVGVAGALMSNYFFIFTDVGVNFALFAFVAVALGGFGSVIGCLYAGIIIGLVESLGGLLIDPSFKLLYVIAIYLLVVGYRPQGLFGEVLMDSPLDQARLEPVWHVNNRIVLLLAALTLFLLGLPLLGPNPFYLHLMILVFMYAVMSQAWNVIAGLSGQISLGHGMFFGIGAYASSVLYVQYGVTPWIGIAVGMVICGVVAVLIGIPMLRLSGHYFAIATLLIGIGCQVIFQRWEFVGAASGLWIPLTDESSWSALQFHDSKAPYYYVFFAFFIVTYAIVWRLGRSKIGFRLRAVRDDPQAAQSLGINVARYKIIAYAISAMIMAPMGSLFAQYILIVDPDRMFNLEISILVLLMAVLGGIGNIWGPLLGVAILIPISEFTRIYLGGTGGAVDQIFYGLILMLICIFRPAGLVSLFPKHLLERKRQS